MSKTPPTAGQTIYRLSVMVGTLSIGSMAAYLYGPPPEKLASLINTAANSLTEMSEHRSSASAPIAQRNLSEAPAAATLAPALFAQSETTPIAATQSQPILSKGVTTNNPTQALRLAGATDTTITPWGSADPSTGQSLYRAATTVPVNGGSGLVERLDAIGETPEKAVEALLAQVNQIRR